MKLSDLLSTLPPDHRIKLGAVDGVAWFYVGTVGDLTKNMAQYNKRLKSLSRIRGWEYHPLSNREVIEWSISDPFAEPEECIRVLITGQELGAFWMTTEADRFPEMKFRVREVDEEYA